MGFAAIGLVGEGFAQSRPEQATSKYSPAEHVLMFQNGVDDYRLGQYRKSFESWLPLARAGDTAAQRNIAHLWLHGLGVQKNLSEALPWYLMSAEGGIAESYTQLGILYVSHPELDRDYEKAATYFYNAARNDDKIAQYNLGLMYENGLGVKTDRNTAATWYGFAAQAGHARATQRLAVLQISPETTDSYPPAPAVKGLIAGTAQPRVVKTVVDENQKAIDDLVNAISTPPEASGNEAQDQSSKTSAQSSDDLLSSLASSIADSGVKGRGSLPASAFIDDSVEPERVEPVVLPEQTALDIKAVELPSSAVAPPVVIEQTEPRSPQMEANADAEDMTADTEQPAIKQTSVPTTAAAVAPAPAVKARDIEIAALPRPKPVIPKPSFSTDGDAVPEAENIALVTPAVVTVVKMASGPRDENPAKEAMRVNESRQTGIEAAPAAEKPVNDPAEVSEEVIAPSAQETTMMATERSDQSLPEQQIEVSMAIISSRSLALIATEVELYNPSMMAPKAKPVALTIKTPLEQPVASFPPKPKKTRVVVVKPVKPSGIDKKPEKTVKKKQQNPAVTSPVAKQKKPRKLVSRNRKRQAAVAAYNRGETARALQMWAALAGKGDRVGKFWLGRMYNRGEGVSRDPVRAYELFRSAARSGYSPAVTALANLQARMTDAELKNLERAISSN